MQRMTWTADCRLGIDALDSQHRLLFAIANELLEIDQPEEQKPEIKYLLTHLRNYVEEHFSAEENFVHTIQYPYLEAHRRLHQQIVSEINHAVTSTRSLTALMGRVEALMARWIRDHILAQDKKIQHWVAVRKSTQTRSGESPDLPVGAPDG